MGTTIGTTVGLVLLPLDAGRGSEMNRPVVIPPYLLPKEKDGIVYSKGGHRNIWQDQYGYPPNVKDVDWKKADGKLADDLSDAHGDRKRGQGTPNNLARKWFRDKRSK